MNKIINAIRKFLHVHKIETVDILGDNDAILYLKVGEIANIKELGKVKCVRDKHNPNGSCHSCIFNFKYKCNKIKCNARERKDNKEVHFIKVY